MKYLVNFFTRNEFNLKLFFFGRACQSLINVFLSAYYIVRFAVFRVSLERAEFIRIEEKSVSYLINSKVACTAIKSSMLSEYIKNTNDDYEVHKLDSDFRTTKEYRGDFTFTLVRNPFLRLVSCYINKFEDFEKIKNTGFEYQWYLCGILKINDDFESFVRKISKIPDGLSDRHFMSQSFLINKFRITKVIKLEEIGEYEKIANDFGFAPLGKTRNNKSRKYNIEDYYTSEILDMVYKRYEDDILKYGYEDYYKELKSRVQ